MPLIRARIERFLSEAQRAHEFSHTVLHNNPAKNHQHPAMGPAAAPAATKHGGPAAGGAADPAELRRAREEAERRGREDGERLAREQAERRAHDDEARPPAVWGVTAVILLLGVVRTTVGTPVTVVTPFTRVFPAGAPSARGGGEGAARQG